MKIKKLNLSDKVILAVAEDIDKSFTLPKYQQFLTKHDLLSYNPNDYSYFNNIDFIRDTLGEIDERLFEELDNKGILSDETKDELIEEGIVFEKTVDIRKASVAKRQDAQQSPKQISPQKLSTPTKEPEIVNSAIQHKTFLPNYVAAFLILLVALGIFWVFLPDAIVFAIIVRAAIIVILSLGILTLKHDGKISDNAFVNAIGKIAEIIKSFTKS